MRLNQSLIDPAKRLKGIVNWGQFLSPEDVERTRLQVLSLRQHWAVVSPEVHQQRGAKGFFYRFGAGLTYLPSRDHIDRSAQEVLRNEFSWLYDKLFRFLEEKTGRECMFNDALTVPGFHISELDIEALPKTFHVDNTVDQCGVGYESDSIISLISAGSFGAGLEYICPDTGKHKVLPYEHGVMYVWSQTLSHRFHMPGLRVLPGEARITLQGHYYVDPVTNKNVPFF